MKNPKNLITAPSIATISTKKQELFDDLFLRAYNHIDRLERSYSAINHLLEAVVFTDLNANVLWANRAMEAMTGYELNELVGQPISIIKSDHHDQPFYKQMWDSLLNNKKWEGEVWNRRKNGTAYLQFSQIYTIYDDQQQPIEYLLVALDLTEKNDLQEELNINTYYDQLTGLPNKNQLKIDINQKLTTFSTDNLLYYVAVDINRFSYINHSFSYVIGDVLLVDIANRLKDFIKNDQVYRFSSDMFVFLLSNVDDDQQCLAFVKQLDTVLSSVYEILGHTISVSSSYGITKIPNDGQDFDTITKNAESALRDSKQSDFMHITFFNPLMNQKFTKRFLLGNALQRALDHDELQVNYQIQVSNKQPAQAVSAEALIRWNHPKFGLIQPEEFIPYAELSGLIVPLGYWIINQVCQFIVTLRKANLKPINFTINMSAKQLGDPSLVSNIQSIIKQYDISPTQIEFEVTETNTIIANTAIPKLQQLRKLGFKIAIDDFGTGYSSLSYLASLPIDKVKIDRSFISNISQDTNRQKITSGIIALAKSIDLMVVAEGVETKEDVLFLNQRDCDYLQGFYYSRPIPAEQLKTLLTQFP